MHTPEQFDESFVANLEARPPRFEPAGKGAEIPVQCSALHGYL